MKRLRGTRGWNYNSLMLYREDLEELLRIFNPSGAAGVVTISDSGAEFESLDEMKTERGERVEHIIIKSNKPFIVINLQAKPKALNLYTVEATDEADVAFFKAHEFLHPKRRPLNTFVTETLMVVLIGATTAVGSIFGLFGTIAKVSWLPWALYPLLFVLAIALLAQLDKRTAVFLSLGRRRESSSFFHRKRDELIMLLIGTLLGVLVTLAIGRLHH